MVGSIGTASEQADASEAKEKVQIFTALSAVRKITCSFTVSSSDHGDNNMTYFGGLLGELKQLHR